MPAMGFVRARIEETVQLDAALVLAEMGLTVSDLVRMTLTREAKTGRLPFPLDVPNAETLKAMEESRSKMKTGSARFKNGQELFDALDAKIRK